MEDDPESTVIAGKSLDNVICGTYDPRTGTAIWKASSLKFLFKDVVHLDTYDFEIRISTTLRTLFEPFLLISIKRYAQPLS